MTNTSFLNAAVLNGIDPVQFQTQKPFPWVNPQYFIDPNRYCSLLETVPDLTRFHAFFDKQRKHGQASHNRYILDYERGMDLAPQWRAFIEELCSDQYRGFICRLLQVSDVRFRFHWHFTPNGCEVSPHCDSKGKIGSQIFYLNTAADWDWSWGGETVILDDNGRIASDTAPSFDDFDAQYSAQTQDNRSILFGRRGNSWHGVRRINCPENYYRKVFIVVFEEHRPLRMVFKKARRLVRGAPLVTDKERLMY